MSADRIQTLAAWLGAALFALANCVPSGAIVVCLDVHGRPRLELGCNGTISGACDERDRVCDATGDRSGGDHPCRDAPAAAPQHLTKPPTRLADGLWRDLCVPAAPCGACAGSGALSPALRDSAALARPPDAPSRLRTVVLLI